MWSTLTIEDGIDKKSERKWKTRHSRLQKFRHSHQCLGQAGHVVRGIVPGRGQWRRRCRRRRPGDDVDPGSRPRRTRWRSGGRHLFSDYFQPFASGRTGDR